MWLSLAGLRAGLAADCNGMVGAEIAWKVEGGCSALDIEQANTAWVIILDAPSLVNFAAREWRQILDIQDGDMEVRKINNLATDSSIGRRALNPVADYLIERTTAQLLLEYHIPASQATGEDQEKQDTGNRQPCLRIVPPAPLVRASLF